MSVAVYPRLNELLQAHHLTVAELERRIETRFGLPVDPKTLYRLTAATPVQRADLEVAGAVAAILGVGLDDLFDVRAVPVDGDAEPDVTGLTPDQNRRLAALFDRQAEGPLASEEQAEITALVSAYGQALHERHLRELAQQHGMPVEEARREVAAQLDEVVAWWQAFTADPTVRGAVAARVRRRRGRAAS